MVKINLFKGISGIGVKSCASTFVLWQDPAPLRWVRKRQEEMIALESSGDTSLYLDIHELSAVSPEFPDEYKKTFSIIKKEINKWDPYELISCGAPDNEFDDEIAKIVT